MNAIQSIMVVATLCGAAVTGPPSFQEKPQQPPAGPSRTCVIAGTAETWQTLGLTADQVRRVEALRGALLSKSAQTRSAQAPTGDHDKDGKTAQPIVNETTPDVELTSSDRMNAPDTAERPAQEPSQVGELSAILGPEQLRQWQQLCTRK